MNELLERLMKMPNAQKAGIAVILYLLIGAGYYFGLHDPMTTELADLQTRQASLEKEKAETQVIADNLDNFRMEVEVLNEELNKALSALPNERNFDKLMTRMENLAKRIGLDVVSLEPKKDIMRDFYAEVPFRMEVLGSYHDLAMFFFRLGSMARIVNVEDIAMGGAEAKGGKIMLKANAVATTYRFLDESERAAAAAKGKKKGGGKKRKKKSKGH